MASAAVASKTNTGTKLAHPFSFIRNVGFYPAEYIVMLGTAFSSLITLSLLGAALIGYWLDEAPAVLAGQSLTFLSASLIVTLSLHLIFYWRIRHYPYKVTRLSVRVANGALGLFLLLNATVLIILGTWLVYLVLDTLAGTGEVDTAFWAAFLMLAQAILWFKYSTLHFARVRAGRGRARYYILSTGLLALAVIVLALWLPGSVARRAMDDTRIATDLTVIEAAISRYYEANGNLPQNLTELDLDDNLANRAGSYEYTPKDGTNYELCATFADKSGSGQDYGFGYTSHGKGRQCFDRQAYGSSAGIDESLFYDFHTQEAEGNPSLY